MTDVVRCPPAESDRGYARGRALARVGVLVLVVAGTARGAAAGEDEPAATMTGTGKAAPAVAKTDDATTRLPYTPTSGYEKRLIEGFTVRVNKELLAEKELADEALKLMATKLYDIVRVVPDKAVADLRKIEIWMELADKRHACACYHPSRRWLIDHDFNPDKTASVEIANARRFISWSRSQPSMVLHELAHGYHHRVLKHGHAGVAGAFEAATADGVYDSVLHYSGAEKRAYALNNDREYFAESTEAFFGQNDFYPFVRAELKEHDPRMFEVLKKAWRE